MSKLARDFIIELNFNKGLSLSDIDNEKYEYNYEIQNLTNIFYDLSTSFYNREINLLLKIKGIEYVTFACELSILLEELNGLVSFAVGKRNKYVLDFFEPGARYTLAFERVNEDTYSLTFTDNDVKNFEGLVIHESVLELMLSLYVLFSKVIFLTKKVCPSIFYEEKYTVWKIEIAKLFDEE